MSSNSFSFYTKEPFDLGRFAEAELVPIGFERYGSWDLSPDARAAFVGYSFTPSRYEGGLTRDVCVNTSLYERSDGRVDSRIAAARAVLGNLEINHQINLCISSGGIETGAVYRELLEVFERARGLLGRELPEAIVVSSEMPEDSLIWAATQFLVANDRALDRYRRLAKAISSSSGARYLVAERFEGELAGGLPEACLRNRLKD
ncbi:MAG: hypothetical protein V1820_03115 [archaeon]